MKSVLLLAGVALLAAGAAAQAVPDRATLQSILGGNQTIEDFEGMSVQNGSASGLGVSSLDYKTVVFGNTGPGLVAFGATYSVPGGSLTWMGPNFSALNSHVLGANLQSPGRMDIDYEVPVPAMGLDVTTIAFAGASGTARFKDPGGVILGTVPFTLPGGAGQRAFVGWQHAGGIGSVEITMPLVFSPMIEDHLYGIDQSQVALEASYGTGCNEIFASFYESNFAFDLSNTSFRLSAAGTGFVFTPGTNPVVPPTASPSGMGNFTVSTFPLGWSFPYPGGVTTDLFVSSHGFVHFVPNNDPDLTNLLGSGPVVAAKARGLLPGNAGTVTFESDPVAQTATVTFDQVPDDTNLSALNTFQFAFDAGGNVEVRYGACAPTFGFTGWSPGNNNLDPGGIDISATPLLILPLVDALPLRLVADARPAIGATVNLTIERMPVGSALAAHFFGLVQHTQGTGLAGIGMPGCFQYCSQDAVVLTSSPAGTTVTAPFAVPNDPGLAGVVVSAQGAIFDPAGGHNALGVLATNGVELVINLL